jgi:hypothetical protein
MKEGTGRREEQSFETRDPWDGSSEPEEVDEKTRTRREKNPEETRSDAASSLQAALVDQHEGISK